MPSVSSATDQLCLACGICCNGVLFHEVKLQSVDNGTRLAALGIPVETRQGTARFRQPCPALNGCKCGVYPERPADCREFECLLLKSVQAGLVEVSAALEIIQTARQKTESVRRRLVEFGDKDESLTLTQRFHQLRKRMDLNPPGPDAAVRAAQLSLALRDLNQLLRDAFYPDMPNPDPVTLD